MSWRYYGMIIAIILFSSCKPMAQQAANEKTLESIVIEKLGEKATIEKNKDHTFALCYQQNISMQNVSYIVIRLSDLKIIEQDIIARATLSWMDTYKIQIRTAKGIVREDAPIIEPKIIDVTKYVVKL